MQIEHEWGLPEEEVEATLKKIVPNWCGTHWDIFCDLKSKFTDKNVKAEIGYIKSEIKEFYDVTIGLQSQLVREVGALTIAIDTVRSIINTKKPPEGRKSLENICREVVTTTAPNEANALIEGNYHIQIASGVILDD